MILVKDDEKDVIIIWFIYKWFKSVEWNEVNPLYEFKINWKLVLQMANTEKRLGNDS